MSSKTTSSTIRATLEEQHKFEALRRYYEKKDAAETGRGRRLTHAEVLARLLDEPEIRAKWESVDRANRI